MKLDPPSDLQSNVSSGSYVLTWSISPALEPLASLLSYELAFKRQEEVWEVMLGLATLGPLSLLGVVAQGHSSSHMRRGGDQSQDYVSNVHMCVCVCRHVCVSVPVHDCVCMQAWRACLCGSEYMCLYV